MCVEGGVWEHLVPYCMQIKNIWYKEKWATIDDWAFDYDDENIVLRSFDGND